MVKVEEMEVILIEGRASIACHRRDGLHFPSTPGCSNYAGWFVEPYGNAHVSPVKITNLNALRELSN
ncbi:hypothetical protein V6Z12_D05G221800 [Gossypium hirsutum]